MSKWADFWWESITGSRNLTMKVARALQAKGIVCLAVPDDLPWRNEMRGCIENEMHQLPEMEDYYVDLIDVEDECADIDDIGRYLLERYATPSIAAGFRRRETIQKYLRDNHVLDNRILWVKGMGLDQEKKWVQFCRDYIPGRAPEGRFVLEVRWLRGELERKNFAVIRFESMVNHHDLSLFNSIFVDRECSRYSPIWQQYIAVLCAQLCNTDAETSYALMMACDFMMQEPIEGIRKVADDGAYRRRGESNSLHILNALRSEDLDRINILIWKAQLQVLFPLIEMERVSFVTYYHDKVDEAIRDCYYDNRSGRGQRILQFGEFIDNPTDAELGTIYRMTKLRKESDYYQYLLYIPNEQDRNRIDLLHSIRNDLAHGKPCDVARVAEFINGHPYSWNDKQDAHP